jgi:hypothetical protein
VPSVKGAKQSKDRLINLPRVRVTVSIDGASKGALFLSLSFFFFFFLAVLGLIQGLVLGRQVLKHLSHL